MPNASPRSPSSVASTIMPRAAGSYAPAAAPEMKRSTNSAAAVVKTSGSIVAMPSTMAPPTRNGLREVRSAR